MMFLPLSALLFSLVALELSATIKKSTEEGHTAFLVSRIQSSEPRMLAEKLHGPLMTKDSKTLQLLLVEGGVKAEIKNSFQALQTLEVSLAQDFERQYNLILYYLSDDLKEFFGKCKILWDVENLKTLLCYMMDARSPQKPAEMAGPFGYLDSRTIKSLQKSRDPEELINSSTEFLPVELSSKLALKEWSSMNDVEFALDLAAFEFLQETSEGIRTQKARLAWEFMRGFYEVENTLTIGRLKLLKMESESIKRFLFPSWRRLDRSECTSLIEAPDYVSFLHTLRGTFYGKWIPDVEVDPGTMESSLRKAALDVGFENVEPETSKVVRFLAELEMNYGTIRRATFLASIKALDEE